MTAKSSDPSDDYVDPGDPLWFVPAWYRLLLASTIILAVVIAHV